MTQIDRSRLAGADRLGVLALVTRRSAVSVLLLVTAVGLAYGQVQAQGPGLPSDRSHNHVIFSNPGTLSDAIKNGASDRWYKIVSDPRYRLQQQKRSGNGNASGATTDAATADPWGPGPGEPTPSPTPKPKPKSKADWSYFLGSALGGAGVSADATPAKYTWNLNSTPSCTSDFAVYAIDQSGGTSQPSIVAFNGLYSGPAVAASALGVVTTNGVSAGKTLVVNNVTLTASSPTAAAGSVQINCTTSTCGNYTTTIGSTVYSVQSNLSGATPSNQVLDAGSGAPNHTITAENLRAAMLNDSTKCGSTAPCFRNVSAANPTVTPGSAANPLVLTASTAGTGGNSIVLSDTGCINGCSGTGLSEVSLNTTNTGSNVDNTTLGASTAGSDGTTTAGSTFAYWSVSAPASASQLATNLATAIGGVTGVSAGGTTASGSAITVTASATGASTIALGVPSFAGLTWSSGTLLGGSAAGSGSPCTNLAPNVYWAYYNTSSTAVLTSPVLSYDGTKVAFVEEGTSGAGATLRLIKWSSTTGNGTPGAPVLPGNTATNWTACGTSGNLACQITLTYNSAHAATNTKSAPFYDYNSDALYIGSDNGYLYKVAPVFNGGSTAPAVVANWPVLVHTGCKLGSPVYDPVSTNVLVADSCGQVSYVTTGATPGLGGTTITGLTNPDDPIVDSSLGKVYVFTSSNGSNAEVLQANTTLSSVVTANIGAKSTTVNVYDGMFDNNYYNNGTGYLYACGNPGGAATLYRVPLTTGAMGTVSSTTIPLASATTGGCSPMSEVYNTNTNTDWLLFGLTANCAFGGSATGCVNSLNISGWTTGAKTLGQTILDSNFNIQKVTSAGTSGASAPSWNLTQDGATSDSGVTWTNLGQLIPSATQAEAGGTSGIVVDNVSTSAHSSSMYFTTLTGSQTCGTSGGGNNSTCAVNVTQAGLH